MAEPPLARGIVTGTVVELTAAHAVVREESGARWQVPRHQLTPEVGAGDRVTLCVLPGSVVERQELARALLNQLLSGAEPTSR